MKRMLHASLVTLIIFFAGCKSGNPTLVTDQLPHYVPKEQLLSTIKLTMREVEGPVTTYYSGCGIILDENHLLTNSHIWATKDGEISQNRNVQVTVKCKKGKDHLHSITQNFKLVADSGDRDLEDWALIYCEDPYWNAKNAAYIHPPATHPDWIVPEGTELFIVGFSPIFFEKDITEFEKPNDDPSNYVGNQLLTSTNRSSFIKDGPYTIRAESFHYDESEFGLSYSNHWPIPLGHSGGGVYIWNKETQRLELVGVFHSRNLLRTEMTRDYHFDFFGTRIPLYSSTKKDRTAVLHYSRIGNILATEDAKFE